ncbi:MAG TPA: hypothetical protein VK611_25795 [Acidimicrobiales bacterium]|nr:hypothetical protein [Acidimicrobiales bacterium]
MNDTLWVAVIVGTTGVLAGLSPAHLAGRHARRQAAAHVAQQHADWLLERRFTASTDLLDSASTVGHRSKLWEHLLPRDRPDDERARAVVEGLTPIQAAVNRLGVLGPPELAEVAGEVGQAAMACIVNAVQQDEAGHAAADARLTEANLAFQEVAYRLLAAAPPR